MMSGRGERLEVALIGYGLGGEFFHAPMIAATPALRLAHVVTSDADRADRARQRHPGVRVHPETDALWGSGASIDLVVIAAPNRAHFPLGREAIRRGIPVVIDKPLTATVEDALTLAREAREAAVPLSVYHNRRLDGDFLTVRKLVQEEALGEIYRFESRFERWRPVVKQRWRESPDPRDAGGLLYDLGSHVIDQALVLFGRPEAVYAEVDRRREGAEVDDDCFLALTHASGVRSHLWTSATAASPAPRFRLGGSRGAYVKFGMDVQEEDLMAGRSPADADWGAEPPERWGYLTDGESRNPVATERGNYTRFYVRMAEAVHGSASVPVAPEEAIAVLEVIQAARRSAMERRVVPMNP